MMVFGMSNNQERCQAHGAGLKHNESGGAEGKSTFDHCKQQQQRFSRFIAKAAFLHHLVPVEA
jgi:hypothetical protein